MCYRDGTPSVASRVCCCTSCTAAEEIWCRFAFPESKFQYRIVLLQRLVSFIWIQKYPDIRTNDTEYLCRTGTAACHLFTKHQTDMGLHCRPGPKCIVKADTQSGTTAYESVDDQEGKEKYTHVLQTPQRATMSIMLNPLILILDSSQYL
ncbi:hypothetical protein M501DRAFT_1002579 [Patellaria atrata CBS 101060]|uniref:Uncharacterized protein n=1 Tax=Patellaria atrata CBS 101060 TaxID=1346257 RepID=A0A9P4SD41_9PEZI|nr:hypothetical protein M501DRAFT_1002579 [Patellaria atrata CBS 101060]